MASPFQGQMGGPGITPKTMGSAAQGGQQNPTYLQARRPVPGGAPGSTQPMITPKPMAMGDTVNPTTPKPVPMPTGGPQITPAQPNGGLPGYLGSNPPPPTGSNPPSVAGASSPLPPQAGGNSLGDVYKFFASDLANQTKQAKANAVSDASARGVYYGSPLTGSEADIDTQYLRGMGQLQSGMYGNEQQNQLARLGIASNLGMQGAFSAPPTPGPMDFSGLGALFGNNPTSPSPMSPTNPSTGGQRNGPVITPPVAKTGEGGKVQSTNTY